MSNARIAAIAPAALAAFFAISPSAASASTGDASTISGLADCTYQVTRTMAVYEKPTNASTLLKFKHKGDRVRGFSRLRYYNRSEHVRYRAVDIKKAADDIGWMDTRALKLVRCGR